VRSLRAYVLVGAAMWSVGLLATWATTVTLHREALQTVAIVHRSPHLLMMSAILLMLAGFAVVRRGIAPLDDMRRRLAAVRAGAIKRVDGRFPTEVQPLVTDLNALLAHQEQAVSRAAAKAGDLAHGLKTPLAILAQEAEHAAADGHAELAAAVQEQIERMRRQIEYHLAHARAAASGAVPGARCAIAVSAEALARTLRRLYADRGITIEVHVDPAHEVRCERADLDELLGNLLDNACKWTRGRVTIGSSPAPEGYTIVVEDDGPGIEPALRDAVLQRGVRADEAAPGSGLGLSIVRDLAELYGGRVSLEAAAGGGLAARLTLPAASHSATTQSPTPN
jgi:signal transduction histidine kinase